ncbi:hypothetical protein TWF718_002874 [Orbilia javanica]|uniref:F-box domain-containing protein n=1 Tax=Orbilia javanica TaxID=47235 RepID=A0AAN8RBM5_9PEZI
MYDLPNELTAEVGAELDEDDWLALRMTCQKFNDRFKEFHLNAKYQHRRVFLCRQGVQNLGLISEHPSGMNLRVQRLDVVLQSPFRLCSEPDMPLLVTKEDIPLAKRQLEIMAEEQEDGDLYAHDAIDFETEVGHVGYLLQHAMSNLPSLRSVFFTASRKSKSLSRSECNIFYPELDYGPGTRIPEAFIRSGMFELDDCSLDVSMGEWDKILPVVFSVPDSNLESLTWIQRAGSADLDSLGLFTCNIGSDFPGLRVLKVSIGAKSGYKEIELWRSKFRHWVGSIGSTVEELELDVSERQGSNRPEPWTPSINFLELPESHALSGLAKLNLCSFVLEAENLKSFLVRCKENLRELTLSRFTMQDPETGCFKLLKFLNDGFRLRLFKLEFQDGSSGRLVKKPTDYLLPSLSVRGDWSSSSTKCMVKGQYPKGGYSFEKYLKGELTTHDSPNEFWSSISNGLCINSKAIYEYNMVHFPTNLRTSYSGVDDDPYSVDGVDIDALIDADIDNHNYYDFDGEDVSLDDLYGDDYYYEDGGEDFYDGDYYGDFPGCQCCDR